MDRRTPPTLEVEAALERRGATTIAGCDEVGRGAPFGPVAVGIAVLATPLTAPPPGLRDSKLLSAIQRTALVPQIRGWVLDASVGFAEAAEVDAHGILGALNMAGHRALAQLRHPPEVVVLDGPLAWLELAPGQASVHPEVGGDRRCAVVAAASVLAKVARDLLLDDLDQRYPGYGFSTNRGYGTAAHRAAARSLGLTPEHRHSWRFP